MGSSTGTAQHGTALALAMHDTARRGTARRGTARHGTARHGTPGLARSAGFGRFVDHKPQRSHLKGLSHSFPSMDSPDSVAMTNVEQLK